MPYKDVEKSVVECTELLVGVLKRGMAGIVPKSVGKSVVEQCCREVLGRFLCAQVL